MFGIASAVYARPEMKVRPLFRISSRPAADLRWERFGPLSGLDFALWAWFREAGNPLGTFKIGEKIGASCSGPSSQSHPLARRMRLRRPTTSFSRAPLARWTQAHNANTRERSVHPRHNPKRDWQPPSRLHPHDER